MEVRRSAVIGKPMVDIGIGIIRGPEIELVSIHSSSVELRQSKRAARRTGRPSPGADGLRKREFIAAGGLMGYGGSFADTYRLAGIYVARTLKGEKSLASCRSSRVRKLKCS